MYPKYVFNLDEVHKWYNIEISLNKVYNHVLRQQGKASLFPCVPKGHEGNDLLPPLRFGRATMINRIALREPICYQISQ